MKTINTNNQLVDLATASEVTFDTGKIYTLQILNPCQLKLGDNDEFVWNAKDLISYDASKGEALYIRTINKACKVAIVSSVDA